MGLVHRRFKAKASGRFSESEEFFSVPDEWRIDAQDPDLDAIYSSEEKVVEVVHSSDDDVIVYDHRDGSEPVQRNLNYVNTTEKSLLSLDLHPAKAMNVNVGADSNLSLELDKGYFAIANNSWADAAISFQKLADRSLFLFLTDDDFRKKITNQTNIDL